jgi:hypothetical protein
MSVKFVLLLASSATLDKLFNLPEPFPPGHMLNEGLDLNSPRFLSALTLCGSSLS